jgi:hypothetical protein
MAEERQRPTEGHMTTTDFYYLILVIGAFGSFALAMLTATLQYKAWLRQQAPATVRPVRHAAAKRVLPQAA